LRRLNHPNIVKVLATADEDGQHFIIMEYVDGGSLADLLCRQPQLPFELVAAIGLELADALSRAHHLNILHRDLKPANILLAEDGTPRLTDFGLAQVGGLPGVTETGSILGTIQYLSPEAVENRKLDEHSDLWSFGVVLFEMITGRRPFDGETPFELIWAIKNHPLPAIENLRAETPAALADLVKRMLRKDSSARVGSARQVGVELEKIQKDLRKPGVPSKKAASLEAEIPATAPKIRVLIIDDHAVVRQGLRTFIDLQADMEVVGEGSNGIEAVDLAGRLHPDIVLLDLVMPQMDGIQAAAEIKAIFPQARIIILTSFGEDDKVVPAIQAGAQGYLLKNIRPEELVQAVREAFEGKIQLHPDVVQSLMTMVAGNTPGETHAPSKAKTGQPGQVLGGLSEPERTLMRLLAEGRDNREIAGYLRTGKKAVKAQISRILNKLGLEDRDQAVQWAKEQSKNL
jgi:DNA-binding NarL/FixJ family response regulator